MKKKIFIILVIVASLLVSAALVTSYIDSARVRNSVEPKCTIKVVSEDGSKVTYWGLGYKVIRYPSVSLNEPYKNNRGVKYGSWFMNYSLPVEDNEDKLKSSFLEVAENTVAEIGRGTLKQAVEISEEDANILSEIINRGTWKEGTPDCMRDCAINIKGHLVYYHSACGTLIKYNLVEMSTYSSKVKEDDEKSLALSEDDKITVNTILRKYISLNVDDVISEFSYAEDSAIYVEGKPGVKNSGFVNTSEVEINFENVVEQAKKECTVKYYTTQAYFDSSTGMWKVVFNDENILGGDQTVYMNEKGITTLIVYGE